MRSFLILSSLFCCLILQSQQVYFPDANQDWSTKSPLEFNIDQNALDQAIAFAKAHEYEGPRDLRRAILKGFEREPYHKITGPTKMRGGPAGIIQKMAI